MYTHVWFSYDSPEGIDFAVEPLPVCGLYNPGWSRRTEHKSYEEAFMAGLTWENGLLHQGRQHVAALTRPLR